MEDIDNLNKEQEFFKEQISKLDQEDYSVDKSEYKYIFDGENSVKKETEAKQEIYINMTANLLEVVDGDTIPASTRICSNSYFIPIPSGNDPNEYIQAFFSYVENCMASSADQAGEDTKNE